jgi:hypothetical protein
MCATGGAAVVVLILWLTQSHLFRSSILGVQRHHKADQTKAVSNARQIGLALMEFENKYGTYPDVRTAISVQTATGTKLSLGAATSNDIFRQLIASNFTRSERMFYAKIPGARRPDDVITGAEALKKGECGFAYLSGLSSVGNPSRPLVVTPLIPGTDRFDPKPFDGKAIILKADNSVTSMNINKDGHVMAGGRNLLDPTNPVWGNDDKFVIAWPEL